MSLDKAQQRLEQYSADTVAAMDQNEYVGVAHDVTHSKRWLYAMSVLYKQRVGVSVTKRREVYRVLTGGDELQYRR